MANKDFSSPRAVKRLKGNLEESVVFGGAASLEESINTSSPKVDEAAQGAGHRMVVVMDDELYWRVKRYLADPETRFTTFAKMGRELVEQELANGGF